MKMTRGRVLGLALLATIGVAAGCAANEDEGQDTSSAIRELERRAVGPAVAYPADKLTEADEEKFRTSKKARRELGWKILAKALAPVPIAEKDVRVSGSRSTPKLPLFRTWLGGDEIDRMFAKMYGDLGFERRVAKEPPTAGELTKLFEWGTTTLGPSSEEDYFERLKSVTTQQAVDGLGGNARTSYSPGFVRHLFKDYPALLGCEKKVDTFTEKTKPIDEAKNFTNCFASEMPTDAAAIKQSWRRNDDFVDDGLPSPVTTAAELAKRAAKATVDDGAWNVKELPLKKATAKDAYTVSLSDGSGYSLVGLHITTKELRHWTWVTIWWSDKPNEDFGQDRPESIKALGGPWSNYKMCVVTDFDEKDPDPRGGYEGSLGDALAAVHGKSTWCSNPFIEKGAHNAQTNCIGCHQHAGDPRALDKILVSFPSEGRTQIRTGFPTDYSWAVAPPTGPDQKDRFLQMMVTRADAYTVQDEAYRP